MMNKITVTQDGIGTVLSIAGDTAVPLEVIRVEPNVTDLKAVAVVNGEPMVADVNVKYQLKVVR